MITWDFGDGMKTYITYQPVARQFDPIAQAIDRIQTNLGIPKANPDYRISPIAVEDLGFEKKKIEPYGY